MSESQDNRSGPELDYLTRDFASFRRLMLDRLASLSPGAATGHPADLGTTLVEVLASAADELSLYQDAVITESYLTTARLRTSVRRHARLLDYAMHDGWNARVWVSVCVTASADGAILPQGTVLLTRVEGQPAVVFPQEIPSLRSRGALVFETTHDLSLRKAHNQLRLDPSAGALAPLAQSAVLLDASSELALTVGDVLIFEDSAEPAATAVALSRRHPVRLTSVEVTQNAAGQRVVRIGFGAADALPFALTAERARIVGNVVLADHGYSLPDAEELTHSEDRKRPQLTLGPLTWQTLVMSAGQPVLFDPSAAASSAMSGTDGPETLLRPVISLSDEDGASWQARRDLLRSGMHDRDFVVESEDDGRTFLRFGDGANGQRATGRLLARYRIGCGTVGNIGAESLGHIASALPGLVSIRNPLPAVGGCDPESIEQVRLLAPHRFQTQERAVSSDDYIRIAKRYPTVRDVLVSRRYTGSYYTISLTVVRRGGLALDQRFRDGLLAHLDRFRMAGHVLRIVDPVLIPLDLKLLVGIASGHFRSDVLSSLYAALGPGSTDAPGFFHPDRQTLGQPVYLSQLVREAMQVRGVTWVEPVRFRRYGESSDRDVLPMHPCELPRVENLATDKTRGTLELLIGGRP
ncbi:MAG: baseplate J/gp47 family protein [Myxococcales bacterium]|nr:baseplate J/gp47 family protein [Myxococcales bacterium]